ncbi:MAG: TonB family protein [Thermoanaerobaculaceae bacterium]|jgi:TonB family protein|nr:TonB family protein [Thermoanaerobaculaceae bacterium]
MADTYSRFGEFLLLKQRAQDGLGTLWRAGEMERNGFKRIVWLRRFDQAGLDRAALSADVPAANQIAGILKAANVVRNAAYGSEGGVTYVAWDYVPSQPLDQVMARASQEQFPISIDNALLIVEKLAASLAAASAVEVKGEPLIHGFLVPHLALVGNDGEAQVAGFGLARGLRANLDRAAVRKLAEPYVAPEVLAKVPATGRSDVFSLGAILFHILSGQALPADPLLRTAALSAPTLAFDEGPIPQDVLAIIRTALAQLPDDRYASAAEFKKELEKLLYGGVYSPTTFNLALFMDRLFRNEIEQEDRDLQRERAVDVGAYYQPPKSEAPLQPVAAPAASRTGLYAAIAGGVVLLLVTGYLLLNRSSGPSGADQAAQKKMLQDLVNTQVAQALQAKEDQLRKELDAEKARTEELRKQLESQQQGAAGAKPVSAEEQQRLKRELAAREAEQRQKEAELLKVKQQQQIEAEKARQQMAQAQARLASQPAPAPVVPTVAPPAASVPQTAPTQPPVIPTEAPPSEPPPAAAGPASTVREGDLVDISQVDVQPQPLVKGKVTLPASVTATRTGLSGDVVLKVLVNEKGGVEEVRVQRRFEPPKPVIDDACVEAVKQYRYRPAMKDGQKVRVWITMTMQIKVQPSR